MIAIAQESEANEIVTVIKKSILLCIADHQDDAKIIPFLKNNLSLSNSLNLIYVAFALIFLDILISRFGIISQWLANKTVNKVREWIASNYSLVFKNE